MEGIGKALSGIPLHNWSFQNVLRSMSERVNGDVESQLLSIIRANPFSLVATVIGAERTAETVFTHHCNQVAFIEKTFQMNIARFIQATNPVDLVKGAINNMIIWDRFDFFARKYPAELASPSGGKIRIRAATGTKKESTVGKIFL